jgi:hypothetical protein
MYGKRPVPPPTGTVIGRRQSETLRLIEQLTRARGGGSQRDGLSGPPACPRRRRRVIDQPGLSSWRPVIEFARESRVRILMVAGNRESRDPGIGERVERFLIVVFKALGTRPRPTA